MLTCQLQLPYSSPSSHLHPARLYKNSSISEQEFTMFKNNVTLQSDTSTVVLLCIIK